MRASPAKSTITYLNHTGAPLSEIYLRLYPNSAEYAEGGMTVSRIRVDGQKATGALGQDDTLLTIALPTPAANGATITLSFRFETTIPTDPRRSYGMFKYDTDTNTYSLAHWQPLLAGWDRVNGWNTAPVSKNGDPVFTEAAVFDVELTAPTTWSSRLPAPRSISMRTATRNDPLCERSEPGLRDGGLDRLRRD